MGFKAEDAGVRNYLVEWIWQSCKYLYLSWALLLFIVIFLNLGILTRYLWDHIMVSMVPGTLAFIGCFFHIKNSLLWLFWYKDKYYTHWILLIFHFILKWIKTFHEPLKLSWSLDTVLIMCSGYHPGYLDTSLNILYIIVIFIVIDIFLPVTIISL